MKPRPAPVFALLLSAAASVCAAQDHRHPLISARDNLRVDALEVRGALLTPDSPGWSVTKTTLHGGRQEGVELITVDNGLLRFTVVPSRGMSVHTVESSRVRLAWNSPVKEIVHPSFINLHSRGGLGWLEGFNEWMVRCGLESNGHPGTDKIPNPDGTETSLDLTLHGKIGNIPASEVELIVDAAPPHRIRIRGRVDERMVFGPKLELQTEISTEPGSAQFRISDTVTNRGPGPQEFEILYHGNYGSPLLGEGAKFVAPASRVVPFNEHAARFVESYDTFAGPELGFPEQVFCLFPLADAAGRTEAMLRNKAGDRGVSMQFSVKELPFLTLWKNTAAEGEAYVTGIEPGTNFPNNRRIERKLGRVPKLAPGATHAATLDFSLLGDSAAVEAAARRIASIQGTTKAVLEKKPERKD